MHQVTTQTRTDVSFRSRLAAASLAALLALGAIAATTSPAEATSRGDGLRRAANDRRASEGLKPVRGTALLDDIADKRADNMRDRKELNHDMDYVRQRLAKAGVCWSAFGEIVAGSGGTYSYKSTMTQWWNSDMHHAILMRPGYDIAGGSWKTAANGRHYSVMIFVDRCGTSKSGPTLLKPDREYSPDRRMVFRSGTHTARRFTSRGAVIDMKQVTLRSRLGADSTGRSRVGDAAHLKVSNGVFAGWWVRESWRSAVRGMTQKRGYKRLQELRFAAGTYTGFTFDWLGRVTSKKTAKLHRRSGADARARAIINGRPYFKVASGIWRGYWVRDTRSVNRIR